jgi:hypothetical protein
MSFVNNIFEYTGITEEKTHSSELKNKYYQPIINYIYLFLSLYAGIVPFFFKKFYFNDNKFILLTYIVIVCSVYFSCVKYFKNKDEIEFISFVNECTDKQKCRIRTTFIIFCLMSIYLTVGIPLSTILTVPGISSFQIVSSVIVGIFWGCFTMVCCAFYLYINAYCMGMTCIIKTWLKGMKRLDYPTDLYLIFQVYKKFYKLCKAFKINWNNIVCLIFMIITFRIPFSFILVFYNEIYWEAPLLAFHFYNWIYFVLPICEVNSQNDELTTYFYKHSHIIADKTNIEEIVKYNSINPLGINIFGFMPKYTHLVSIAFIFSNVLVPLFIGFLTDTLKAKE